MRYTTAILTLAGLSGLTLATAIKRQTPDTCTTTTTGYLAVRPANNSTKGPITYAGVVDGVVHGGIDGSSDSLIVTKDDDGNLLAPQVWEFARCTNQGGQAPPPGYVPPTSGPVNLSFGLLRPQAATQHCLALESTSDTSDGSRNSVVDSYCTEVPAQYRTWMYVDYIYGDSANPSSLYFADQNTTVVIGNTEHAELQFFTNDAAPGGEPMQLELQPVPA